MVEAGIVAEAGASSKENFQTDELSNRPICAARWRAAISSTQGHTPLCCELVPGVVKRGEILDLRIL